MAVTDRDQAGRTLERGDIAAAIREADLCHLLARADGDAIAAAATLACACEATATPYQVSAVRTRADLGSRLDSADPDAAPIVVGATAPQGLSLSQAPVSRDAHAIARELDAAPDPETVLAGIVAGGRDPAETVPEFLDSAGVEPSTGVAVPTEDLVDGLVHSTLAHADFSGDPGAAADQLAALGEESDSSHVASVLALAAAGPEAANDRAATTIERAVRSYRGSRFETIGGYADVLGAVARSSPGLGVALAMSGEGQDAALSTWRECSRAAHDAVRSADCVRYDGLFVARVDGPVEPVARLLRDFRSPEPVVLAAGNGEVGIAAVAGPVDESIEAAAEAVGGSGLGRGRRGYARFDPGTTEAFVEALREAL